MTSRRCTPKGKKKGFAFSPTAPAEEFEEVFSTRGPDQLKSVEEIKRDMESPRIMDRLLCGDVGYGKTEVALRAAFKTILDGKQVAMLAPPPYSPISTSSCAREDLSTRRQGGRTQQVKEQERVGRGH